MGAVQDWQVIVSKWNSIMFVVFQSFLFPVKYILFQSFSLKISFTRISTLAKKLRDKPRELQNKTVVLNFVYSLLQ
jgi:hypothetical protein